VLALLRSEPQPPPLAILLDGEGLASALETITALPRVGQTSFSCRNFQWGTDYMHARFNSPLTGRMLSFDPIGGSQRSPQTWNRYAYVTNNPLKYTDPEGLFEVGAFSDTMHAALVWANAFTTTEVLQNYGVGEGITVNGGGGPTTKSLFGPSTNLQLSSLAHFGGLASASADLGGVTRFSWGRAASLSSRGFLAYTDGFIPFVDPLAFFGAYDVNEVGMSSLQVTGEVAFIGASLGAGLETKAGEAGGNAVSRYVFRYGIDKQGSHCAHLHLGPGKQLMKHHLPGQSKTWWNHFKAKVGSAVNHMLGRK
jgi:RHS repeat-associated protein